MQIEFGEVFLFPVWETIEKDPTTGYAKKPDIYGVKFSPVIKKT